MKQLQKVGAEEGVVLEKHHGDAEKKGRGQLQHSPCTTRNAAVYMRMQYTLGDSALYKTRFLGELLACGCTQVTFFSSTFITIENTGNFGTSGKKTLSGKLPQITFALCGFENGKGSGTEGVQLEKQNVHLKRGFFRIYCRNSLLQYGSSYLCQSFRVTLHYSKV